MLEEEILVPSQLRLFTCLVLAEPTLGMTLPAVMSADGAGDEMGDPALSPS